MSGCEDRNGSDRAESEGYMVNGQCDIVADVEAVITSYNQGDMILEAVHSLCAQTLLPEKIIIVDDGSTDKYSIHVLKDIEKNSDLPVPVTIHYQQNGGVSSARNAGIKKAQSSLVLVLDGDDKLEPA